ncbi:MAG: carbamate kinase [Candidatus Thorarchaeota archaeon]
MTKIGVVAIGGNSLIKDKDHRTIPDQYAAAAETCRHIADMILEGWDVVITSGNGPQVGFILRRSELAASEVHEVPLDYCGAMSQGSIGYMITRAMRNEFHRRGIDKPVAGIVTQVIVDRNDPAFLNPTKPIGSFMDQKTAEERAKTQGWQVVEDSGRGWRRVVPSPKPKEIAEIDAIQTLVNNGVVVYAVGGGGIPVVRNEQGLLEGVAAVIDKDYASSLLARAIGADLLLISTAVECAYRNFGRPEQEPLRTITASEGDQLIREGHFAAGSMLPKIRASIEFVRANGGIAIITDPPNITRALRGETGTRIVPD